MFDFIVGKFLDAVHSAAGKSNSDYEVRFRVFDEGGKSVLDTDDPDRFNAFLEKMKAEAHEKAEQKEEKLCNHDCAACDSCGDSDWEDDVYDDFDYGDDCGDEEGWDDDEYDDDWDEDDEYDEDIIFEIPVVGVAAAAALIGSVAMLIRALRKR